MNEEYLDGLTDLELRIRTAELDGFTNIEIRKGCIPTLMDLVEEDYFGTRNGQPEWIPDYPNSIKAAYQLWRKLVADNWGLRLTLPCMTLTAWKCAQPEIAFEISGDHGEEARIITRMFILVYGNEEIHVEQAGMNMKERHLCEGDLPGDDRCWGAAIDSCGEDDKGRFWVGNGEYASQVNYCPYCGVKAPMQVISEEE